MPRIQTTTNKKQERRCFQPRGRHLHGHRPESISTRENENFAITADKWAARWNYSSLIGSIATMLTRTVRSRAKFIGWIGCSLYWSCVARRRGHCWRPRGWGVLVIWIEEFLVYKLFFCHYPSIRPLCWSAGQSWRMYALSGGLFA